MASYYGHVGFSTALGVAYGGGALWFLGVDMPTALGGAFLTAAAGMLPDLDSDSGVPVRALFGAASLAIPLILLRRLLRCSPVCSVRLRSGRNGNTIRLSPVIPVPDGRR